MFRISILFSMFAILAIPTLAAAQEADEKPAPFTEEEQIELIEDSIRVQTQEIAPLQKEHGKASAEIHRTASESQQLIRMLKEEKPDKLKRIRDEIENTSRRLALLERAEEILSDMDESAPAEAITELETAIEESKEEARKLQKPFSDRIAEIHRNYNAMNEEFGEAFDNFFLDAKGDFEVLTKKQTYGNYAVASLGASWTSDKGKHRVSINLNLQHDANRWKPRDPKLFLDKYPIYHDRNNNFSFLIADRLRVNAHAHGSNKGKQLDVKEFVIEHLDIEGLEKVLEKVEFFVVDE